MIVVTLQSDLFYAVDLKMRLHLTCSDVEAISIFSLRIFQNWVSVFRLKFDRTNAIQLCHSHGLQEFIFLLWFFKILYQQSRTSLHENAALLLHAHLLDLLLVIFHVVVFQFHFELLQVFVFDFLFLLLNLFWIKIFNINFHSFENLRAVLIQFFLHLGYLLTHRAVPVILDAIIITASNDFSNLCPLAV